MTPETPNHEDLRQLMLENQKLLVENNKLLKKMRRGAIIGFVFRILWLVIIFGLPFYLYLSFVQPNMGVIQEQASLLKQLTGSDFNPESWSSILNSVE
jgi:ABC-type Fe3+ transport system permease subunit